MNTVLPPELATQLIGLELVNFPTEPPWTVARPKWGTDRSPSDIQDLMRWLAWFYGFPDPLNPPAAPLPPRYRFTAVAQSVNIRIRAGRATFDWSPSSVAQFSSIRDLAERLGTCRRQSLSIRIDRGHSDISWLEINGWIRPEFITLTTTRFVSKEKRDGFWRGSRGTSEQCAQFGVIPLDLDYCDGDHATDRDGLRLAERSEGNSIFNLSTLPWAYELPSLGGTYRYLKLDRPITFEDDAIAAKEYLRGPQRELAEEAAKKGIRVDQAFPSGTALCRVPLTVPLKYAWKGDVRFLELPDVTSGPVVDRNTLAPLRSRVREASTRRMQSAHAARIKRTGEEVPGPIRRHLVGFRVKSATIGRIFIPSTCPACGRDGHTSHISEWNWKLTCKRATCIASAGLGHPEWTRLLAPDARRELRAHIAPDVVRRRIAEHPPLVSATAPTHQVQNHVDGSNAVASELARIHDRGTDDEHETEHALLLLGAACGTGKTLGAIGASHFVPLVYSAHQYAVLDAFTGHQPYQIQGLQKGCLIRELGKPATRRGVRRRYLCTPRRDACDLLCRCPAQPRIESFKTPTCVHATLATVASGAVVKDNAKLRRDDVGAAIAEGRLLIIDEAPDFWIETECTRDDVNLAHGLDNFIDAPSRARGEPHREYGDAILRIQVVAALIDWLEARMAGEGDRACGYPETWPAQRVAQEVVAFAGRLDAVEEDYRSLFRICMVPDATAFSGERHCIPNQQDWTSTRAVRDRRTREHVELLVPESVIQVCRALAHILDPTASGGPELVATLNGGEVALRVLTLNPLQLPESTSTVIMSAGTALLERLVPALHPRRRVVVVTIKRAELSSTSRTLLATSSLGRGHAERAFSDRSSEEAAADDPVELSAANKSYLGTLRRAMQEANREVLRMQSAGHLKSGPQPTLLIVFPSVCRWLLESPDGQQWLRKNTQSALSLVPGNPWDTDSDKWGTVIYWGGRGRGENVWGDCRVAITAGDPLPNVSDMDARWGGVIDPLTQSLFDPFEVAVWYSQEAVMQALERTRPGRAGCATVLLHAGSYLPMGFNAESKILIAEEGRNEARRRETDARVLDALADELIANDGCVSRNLVSRLAEIADVDPKTVRSSLDRVADEELAATGADAARSGICLLRYLVRQISDLAGLNAFIVERLQRALRDGATLPTATGSIKVLARVMPGMGPPNERTLRKHLRSMHECLERQEELVCPDRSDARKCWGLTVVACLVHVNILDSVLAFAKDAEDRRG